MTSYIDLHLHSTQSDGSSSPTQVVQRAAELGLSAISLTDHDSVAGVQEAQNIGRDIGVEVIPGTELSVQEAGMGPYTSWAILSTLKIRNCWRTCRNFKMRGAIALKK